MMYNSNKYVWHRRGGSAERCTKKYEKYERIKTKVV